jgi:hypothetical protein
MRDGGTAGSPSGMTDQKSKSKGKGKSRFPSGMTDRKARARARARAGARAVGLRWFLEGVWFSAILFMLQENSREEV